MAVARTFAHYLENWKRRKLVAKRLQDYLSGTLVSLIHPPYYIGRPWSETSHAFFPPCFREVIFTLLLASNRRKEGEVACLPAELWLQVFRRMHRDWFVPNGSRSRGASTEAPGEDLLANLRAGGLGQLAHHLECAHPPRERQPEPGQQTGEEMAAIAAAFFAGTTPPPHAGGSSSIDDWLAADESGEQVQAANAGEEGRSDGFDAYMARARVSDIEQEIPSIDNQLDTFERITRGDPLGRASVAGLIRNLEQKRRTLEAERASKLEQLRVHEARQQAAANRAVHDSDRVQEDFAGMSVQVGHHAEGSVADQDCAGMSEHQMRERVRQQAISIGLDPARIGLGEPLYR